MPKRACFKGRYNLTICEPGLWRNRWTGYKYAADISSSRLCESTDVSLVQSHCLRRWSDLLPSWHNCASARSTQIHQRYLSSASTISLPSGAQCQALCIAGQMCIFSRTDSCSLVVDGSWLRIPRICLLKWRHRRLWDSSSLQTHNDRHWSLYFLSDTNSTTAPIH